MKTSQLMSTLMGAALLSGAAYAQAEAPEGPGSRGEDQGFRPSLEHRGRPDFRERGDMPRSDMRGPMMREQGELPRGPMMRERGDMRGGDMRGPMMHGRGGEGGHQGFHNPEQLKAAGATEQQLEAIKALTDEQQMKRIDLQATVDKAELAMGQIMKAEKPDLSAALKAVDTLSQARAELTKLEIGTSLKIRETLGADVQKKLRELRPPEGFGRPRAEGPCACQRPEGQPPAAQPPAPQERK